MQKETVLITGVHRTTGYAHATKARGLLFIAGQVALDTDANLVGKHDIEAQATQVFENLKQILTCAGATFDDVLKMTVLITDLSYRTKVNEVRDHYLKASLPASTLLVVPSLASPDFLLEIEAIAVAP